MNWIFLRLSMIFSITTKLFKEKKSTRLISVSTSSTKLRSKFNVIFQIEKLKPKLNLITGLFLSLFLVYFLVTGMFWCYYRARVYVGFTTGADERVVELEIFSKTGLAEVVLTLVTWYNGQFNGLQDHLVVSFLTCRISYW